MENWENQNFESEWKKAFEGAEVSPSGAVWQTIDVRLIHSENTIMKNRVVFYQRMAAASVGILLLVSGYLFFQPGYFTSKDSISQNKMKEDGQSPTITAEPKPDIKTEAAPSNTKTILNENPIDNQTVKANLNTGDTGGTLQGSLPVLSTGNPVTQTETLNGLNQNVEESKNNNFNLNNTISTVSLLPVNPLQETFAPNNYSIAYRLADARPAVISQKKKSNLPENKWASVGFSAGSFQPGTSGGEMVQASRNAPASFSSLQVDQPTKKDEKFSPGTSMAFILSAGKRVFKRWVVQGGLSYLNQTSNSSSNIVSVAPANQLAEIKTSGSFSPEATNSVTYTTPNEINSTFQFISIPVQAGYMLVDKKFGVQINGGVSPDFFWKSSIYDQSTQETTTSSVAGSNETFKTVSLAGLCGVEVSYRFSKHYRVSLVPGFRYSFTPIYKENTLASAKPFVADIGLRFRYVFDN